MKEKRKKLIALFLCTVLVAALAVCAGKDEGRRIRRKNPRCSLKRTRKLQIQRPELVNHVENMAVLLRMQETTNDRTACCMEQRIKRQMAIYQIENRWKQKWQWGVTKTCAIRAISKEKLSQAGLVSCYDYCMERHTLKLC